MFAIAYLPSIADRSTIDESRDLGRPVGIEPLPSPKGNLSISRFCQLLLLGPLAATQYTIMR